MERPVKNPLWHQANPVDQLTATRASLAGHLSNLDEGIISLVKFINRANDHLQQIQELEWFLKHPDLWNENGPATAGTVNLALQNAWTNAGFKSEIADEILTIGLDLTPLGPLSESDDEDYWNETTGVEGVDSDEGQGNGYCFKVDITKFTPAREQELVKVIEKYRKKEKGRK